MRRLDWTKILLDYSAIKIDIIKGNRGLKSSSLRRLLQSMLGLDPAAATVVLLPDFGHIPGARKVIVD